MFSGTKIWYFSPRPSIFSANFFEVFIVDSSESMLAHWSEAMFLLHSLIVKSCAGNPHSVVVLLSNRSREIRVRKRSINEDLQELRNAMKDLKAVTDGRDRYLNFDLESAFDHWLDTISRPALSRLVNWGAPTVVILTDSKPKNTTFFTQRERLVYRYHRRLQITSALQGYLPKLLANMTFVTFGEDLSADKFFPIFEDALRANYAS
jgi:hypothetical protein